MDFESAERRTHVICSRPTDTWGCNVVVVHLSQRQQQKARKDNSNSAYSAHEATRLINIYHPLAQSN